MIILDNNDLRTQAAAYELKKYTDLLKGIKYFISGGCIRDLFSIGYFSSDIDIYFPDRIQAGKAIRVLRKANGRVSFSNKQITNIYLNRQKIQIIKHFFHPNEQAIINTFDFTVCCGVFNGESFYFHDFFFQDLAAKRLVVNNIVMPLSTYKRIIKYVHRGFHICDGNLLIIAKAVSTINFNDPVQNYLEFYPDGKIKFKSID